ncbi:MAG: lytic transglycosylase domain-containing protein, partial [Oscillospiraceae bacterium]|nr:lytic transglycosylase domain-containing protein [Oscillospiraceae bacterium]
LMQIMEETFDWIKLKRGDTDTVYYDMYSAEKNIEYGCWLLGFLYEEFGDIDCVAAAYHAGRGNVNNWLSDRRYSADGIHLDYIPISDTAHYVDKINATMKTYIMLYDGK